MSQGPTADFWNDRYRSGQTGWDRGHVSPQLAAWIDAGVIVPPQRIAIPGCGRGWEAIELARLGFAVTAIDYSSEAVAVLQQRVAAAGQLAGSVAVVQADVLHWQPAAPFDAVYEQTCLCALHPDLWVPYGAALARWLKPGGQLLALFMQKVEDGASDGFVSGPPYHCDIHAMRALFPAALWEWPKPAYPRVPHPNGLYELAVPLIRHPA